MNNRLPEIFGAGSPTLVRDRNRASGTIILHHDWMVDRDVSGALLEIANRIAARPHDLIDKPISIFNRLRRRIDEARLSRSPCFDETFTVCRSDRMNVESVHTFLPRRQL